MIHAPVHFVISQSIPDPVSTPGRSILRTKYYKANYRCGNDCHNSMDHCVYEISRRPIHIYSQKARNQRVAITSFHVSKTSRRSLKEEQRTYSIQSKYQAERVEQRIRYKQQQQSASCKNIKTLSSTTIVQTLSDLFQLLVCMALTLSSAARCRLTGQRQVSSWCRS